MNALLDSKPVLEVCEARNMLGKTADELSDTDIELMVQQLELLAKTVIKMFIVQKSNSL